MYVKQQQFLTLRWTPKFCIGRKENLPSMFLSLSTIGNISNGLRSITNSLKVCATLSVNISWFKLGTGRGNIQIQTKFITENHK